MRYRPRRLRPDGSARAFRPLPRRGRHRDSRFRFHHVDARNELYNPFGQGVTSDFRLPVEDGTVDRIGLASVFTHLLEDEVVHYM